MKIDLALTRGTAFLVRSADYSIIAELTLAFFGCCGQEWLSQRVPNGLYNLINQVAGFLIEQNDLFRKASNRRAEIEATGMYGLSTEALFGGERVKQWLQRLAAVRHLALLPGDFTRLMIGNPQPYTREPLNEIDRASQLNAAVQGCSTRDRFRICVLAVGPAFEAER